MSGYPEYSGDAAFVPVTRNPRTPQLVDEYGNQTFYGTTDNANATFPIDERVVEFQQNGVLNGTFARGPADPNHDITDINALPDWTGPVSVSGGAITAQWVASSTYPSGYGLRFTVNAGAASDEAYFEQIVPIGGSLSRAVDHWGRAAFYRVTASDNNFAYTFALQYLDATGAAVGTGVSASAALAADATSYLATAPSPDHASGGPGATARSLRIRIGVKRSSAATSATGTFDVADVRVDAGHVFTLVPDYGSPTFSSGLIEQVSGIMHVRADASAAAVALYVDSANGALYPFSVGGAVYWVPERGSPPSTPASGKFAVYAKSGDSLLYGMDDGGNEYLLSRTNAVTTSGLTVSAGPRLLGRHTASSGAVEEITYANVKSDAGYYTSGDSPTFATVTTTGDIELGNASDTTLHRSGAGTVTIEGSTIVVQGGALGTPSSGTLTNATGLPLGGMSNLAASSIIGNNTGSPATPLALTATQVRTLLALVIGTNVQAWDADLDTLAAATVTSGGTFTPALAFATVGSSTWATTTATGFYTRLLDRVIFNGTYQGVPTNGTAAGNLQMSGFPVASNSTASSGTSFAVQFQGYTKANFTQVNGNLAAGVSLATFQASGSAQNITALAVADIPTGGTVIVRFSGVYYI